MIYILHLDTSTSVCSVALSADNEILFYKESNEIKSHASLLSIFINEALTKHSLKYSELSAVAVSKGPGSYTGLRIGISTAKGICYARDIPLLAVSTLEILTIGAFHSQNQPDALYCPMMDARRMEVYTCLFNNQLEIIQNTSAVILDEQFLKTLLSEKKIFFYGDGAKKAKNIIRSPNAILIEGVYPSARNMVDLALSKYKKHEIENTAYFVPYYLKDFVATKPKKMI